MVHAWSCSAIQVRSSKGAAEVAFINSSGTAKFEFVKASGAAKDVFGTSSREAEVVLMSLSSAARILSAPALGGPKFLVHTHMYIYYIHIYIYTYVCVSLCCSILWASHFNFIQIEKAPVGSGPGMLKRNCFVYLLLLGMALVLFGPRVETIPWGTC